MLKSFFIIYCNRREFPSAELELTNIYQSCALSLKGEKLRRRRYSIFSLNSCLFSLNSTCLNVTPIDCDVIIAIVSALFVMESSRVHQFVLDDIRVDAAIVQ